MCERWRSVDEDGGRFERLEGGECQWDGVVEEVVVGLWLKHEGVATERIYEMMRDDGVSVEEAEKRYKWFGELVRWGGMQTNRLCRVFYMLCKLDEMD